MLRVNGGQVHENQCQMPSGLCLENIIKIGLFLNELYDVCNNVEINSS